jgi:hypothetical protein
MLGSFFILQSLLFVAVSSFATLAISIAAPSQWTSTSYIKCCRLQRPKDITKMTEDCFTRVCGHKAQTGIRLISEALRELAISRQRNELEKDALDHARKSLASVNLVINVIVMGDETRRRFDA